MSPSSMSPGSGTSPGSEARAPGMLPKKRRESAKRKGRHPHKALTDAFCRNGTEAGLYADGDSLYLLVSPSGARRWIQRLMVRGRARKLGLGGFSTVSLAEARELARANRKLAREGGDPRAGGRHHTAGVPTFEEAAHKVLAIHKGAWRKGSKTASQWEGSLRDHAFPELAGKSVDRVTTADMMAVLLPLWTSKYVTARKVLHRISAVMKWAMAQGYRTDNPAGDALLAALRGGPRRYGTGGPCRTATSARLSRRCAAPRPGRASGWRSSSWC